MSLLSRTLFTSGAISLAFLIVKLVRLSRRLRHLPGPASLNIIFGNALDLERARVGTRYNVWGKKYGSTYRIHGPLSEPILILADPKGVNYVLNSGCSLYPRPQEDLFILDTMFGHGLFCSQGEEHRRLRKSISPAFSLQSIEEVSDVLFDLADKLRVDWTEKIDKTGTNEAVLNVSKSAAIFALDAITMTMFKYNCGASDSKIPSIIAEVSNPSGDTFSLVLGILASLFPWIVKLPNPIKTLFTQMRMELARIVDRAQMTAATDGLHAKVLDVLEKDGSLNDPARKREAVVQMIEIVFAGSETSANVMTECFYELSRKSEIQNKLREELIAFEDEHGRAPSYRELTSTTDLPYFDAVIKETLRTKAVLMEISRTASVADTIPLQFPISGTDVHHVNVEPGQLVRIPVRDGINADETIWGPDAAEFRPERWLEKGGLPNVVEDIHAPGNLLTFGDGPKVCLGRLFALAELKIVISILIRNFVFESDGNDIDFYHIGGNTVKPTVRGKEREGVQLPLRVRKVSTNL